MACILSLECATGITSVAVHRQEVCLAEMSTHVPQAASAQLVPLVDQVMRLAGLARHQLEAVAVSSGPGSYTGLRIGVATAKGICFALGIPLLTINTLEVLMRQFQATQPTAAGFLCPMIDARRMEAYCNIYTAQGQEVLPVDARIIGPDSFHEFLQQQPVFFFGDGAAKCQAVLQHPNARFIAGLVPHARQMGPLAWRHWQNRQFADLATFEPLYLKDFIAKKPNPLF
jgi:tRNA threonylcarbamoyladenosine biosynthesis protein TsaB